MVKRLYPISLKVYSNYVVLLQMTFFHSCNANTIVFWGFYLHKHSEFFFQLGQDSDLALFWGHDQGKKPFEIKPSLSQSIEKPQISVG